MALNEYHFITHWFAPGATIEEVYKLIADATALPQWWPSVYLEVTEVTAPGAVRADGTGRQFDLFTKGWLPYTLRWRMTGREAHPPDGLTIGADGDFVGRGIWTFTQTPDGVAIVFDWKLIAEKPLLRFFSPLLKPAFAANHCWAMAQGEISLLRELERRRTPASSVAPPPGPTTYQPYVAFGIGAILLAAAIYVARRRR